MHGFGAGQHLRGGNTLLLVGRDDAAFHGGIDGRDGRAQIEGILGGPFAGALLLGFIQDQVDDGSARFRV